MDLNQQKLTRDEWNNLEIPIVGDEYRILSFIYRSNCDTDRVINQAICLVNFMKIEKDIHKFHLYFYERYFKKTVDKMNKKYKVSGFSVKKMSKFNIKKADIIRINNFDSKMNKNIEIYENILLGYVKKILSGKKANYYYYTITQLIKNKITNLNSIVLEYINHIIEIKKDVITRNYLIENSYKIIERNENLLKYKDIRLYSHQKEVLDIFDPSKNDKKSNLVLYQAATGTGKTLTPLGLVKNKKIIFVCAAKHVGMQLAKCCITMNIPIAVAFGCESIEDIRLHFSAAKEFTRNWKTGGIFKVENLSGEKVELIVSDIQSYLFSMKYMMNFNAEEDIVWYWDEPTISLDYSEHRFHQILKNNWRENKISNIVLSSATLPDEEEIDKMVLRYKMQFGKDNAVVHSIKSYEFTKTISIVNRDGYLSLPHLELKEYDELKKCLGVITKNKTFLRHMDIREVCKFIKHINEKDILSEKMHYDNYFEDVGSINCLTIKEYYLNILNELSKETYDGIYEYFQRKRSKKYESNIKITTSDAYTLTDGPTIFLTENVPKIARFYLKVSKIPGDEIKTILNVINRNAKYVKELDKTLEQERQRMEKKNEKTMNRDEKGEEYKIKMEYEKKVEGLKKHIKPIELRKEYVPNSERHMNKWINNYYDNAFTSDISEEIVEEIVSLNISEEWKILLLMGVGVFIEDLDKHYIEIMKKLAQEQKLYLIIASSDYIYGTNYQFCHGYLGKEFNELSREKIIQAMGRVGRRNNQLDYTIRIRDNGIIRKLFLDNENKPEVENMNKLFGF
tara:strand:+ start:2097 stop:4478 length:2382 start_codon:yes stop_codon:yes gene_type:complete